MGSDVCTLTSHPVCVACHSCSLPHFDDSVSGRRDDEALRGLKGGDVSDDVMVPHGQGFWAAARRVLCRAALLFTVDFLHRQETQLDPVQSLSALDFQMCSNISRSNEAKLQLNADKTGKQQ